MGRGWSGAVFILTAVCVTVLAAQTPPENRTRATPAPSAQQAKQRADEIVFDHRLLRREQSRFVLLELRDQIGDVCAGLIFGVRRHSCTLVGRIAPGEKDKETKRKGDKEKKSPHLLVTVSPRRACPWRDLNPQPQR